MAKQNIDDQRQAAYDQVGSADVGLISPCPKPGVLIRISGHSPELLTLLQLSSFWIETAECGYEMVDFNTRFRTISDLIKQDNARWL
jgi:hypothetical protein